jgi:hypothetical protein
MEDTGMPMEMNPLTRALLERQRLEDERRKIDERIQRIDRFVEAYHEFAGDPLPATPPPVEEVETIKAPGGMSQEEFEKLVREILLDRGYPLTAPELAARLRERGRPVGGKNELRNVGNKLWRAEAALFNIRGKGYWLRDTPNPKIGYDLPKLSDLVIGPKKAAE